MNLLKQSTAAILKLGPFVDSTDGVTAETGLTIGQADIQISKNGAAFAQTSAASPTTTHDADGWYPIPLTTTDTGTLGRIKVQITMSGALPVWWEGLVVPAAVWDSLVGGTDYLPTDVTGASAATISAAVWSATSRTLTSDTTSVSTGSGAGGRNVLAGAAVEGSTIAIRVNFKDPSGDAVQPTSGTWKLTKEDGTLISTGSLAATATSEVITLSGTDLPGSDFSDSQMLCLTVEAVYGDDDLPLKDSAWFKCRNLVGVS
jgi:hypothetical protein